MFLWLNFDGMSKKELKFWLWAWCSFVVVAIVTLTMMITDSEPNWLFRLERGYDKCLVREPYHCPQKKGATEVAP